MLDYYFDYRISQCRKFHNFMVKMPYFDVLGNYAGLRSVLVLFHKFKDLKRAIKMMVCSSKASFLLEKSHLAICLLWVALH